MNTADRTYDAINARVAPLVTALGTSTDAALTVAVAAALTPEERRSWLSGEDAVRTGIGTGYDIDADWTRDVVWHAFPGEAPESWWEGEFLPEDDGDPDYGKDVDGIFD